MFKPKAKRNLLTLAISLFYSLHYITTRTEVACFPKMYYCTSIKCFCHSHVIISCVRHVVITYGLWGIYEICIGQNTTIFGQDSLCLPTRVTCFDPYICHSQAHNSKNAHWGRQCTGSRLNTHSEIKSNINFFFVLWCCDPTRAMACSFLRFFRSHTTTQHSR